MSYEPLLGKYSTVPDQDWGRQINDNFQYIVKERPGIRVSFVSPSYVGADTLTTLSTTYSGTNPIWGPAHNRITISDAAYDGIYMVSTFVGASANTTGQARRYIQLCVNGAVVAQRQGYRSLNGTYHTSISAVLTLREDDYVTVKVYQATDETIECYGTITAQLIAPIPGSVGSKQFDYTGSVQTWVVPDGVTSIDAWLYGASGGLEIGGSATPSNAAEGAKVETTLSVTPGETLRFYVGGAGTDGALTSPSGVGGWNGGGGGGANTSGLGSSAAGGGGGASDIRQGGTALSDRIAVAGGGGGEGSNDVADGFGGVGGTLGSAGSNGANTTGGGGGTASAGGAAGTDSGAATPATAGALGVGGAGGLGSSGRSGGGGGGGYYGGGGGGGSTSPGDSGSGGGGGSSYSAGTDTIITDGENLGNGYIIITWS